MSLKTTIKNDLWRYNYVIPFIKKHQFDEKGKAEMMKHVLHAYKTIRPVKAGGKRSVGADTKAILEQADLDLNTNGRFICFLDTAKTIAVPGNILSNFTLAYDKIIHGTFAALEEQARGGDEYGREAQLVSAGVRALARRISDGLKASDRPDREKLAGWFDRMADEPAAHFEEALQRILFFNQILWQTRHRPNGLGRLDRILGDLYEKDLESGFLTEEEAHSAAADFLACLSLYPDYKSDALEGDIGQSILL